MLICDKDSGPFEGSLTESGSGGNSHMPAFVHRQISLPSKDVYHIRIDKSAIVVSNVDHHALLRLILSIEIDVELI